MFLPYVESTEHLMLFSAIYGLNWLSTVPATSTLTADLFGKQNVGVVFGWILFAHQIGASLGSYSAGYMHTLVGNYTLIFIASGVFAIIATGLVFSYETNISRKVRVLNHAKSSGNVSKTCRYFGISRDAAKFHSTCDLICV